MSKELISQGRAETTSQLDSDRAIICSLLSHEWNWTGTSIAYDLTGDTQARLDRDLIGKVNYFRTKLCEALGVPPDLIENNSKLCIGYVCLLSIPTTVSPGLRLQVQGINTVIKYGTREMYINHKWTLDQTPPYEICMYDTTSKAEVKILAADTESLIANIEVGYKCMAFIREDN